MNKAKMKSETKGLELYTVIYIHGYIYIYTQLYIYTLIYSLASPHPAVPIMVLLWLVMVHFHSSVALLPHLAHFSSSVPCLFEFSGHLETEVPAWHYSTGTAKLINFS